MACSRTEQSCDAVSSDVVCSIFGAALLFVKDARMYNVDSHYDCMVASAFSMMAVWGYSEYVRAVRMPHIRLDMCDMSEIVLESDRYCERLELAKLYRMMPFTTCQWRPVGELPFAVQVFAHDWEQLDKHSVDFKQSVVCCADRHCRRVGVYVKRHLRRYLPTVYCKESGDRTYQHIGMQLADAIAPGDPSVSPSMRSECMCNCCKTHLQDTAPDGIVQLFGQMFHVNDSEENL